MDFKYLNTFRVIVDEGSFSKAAEKLNYTQSTITFQIGQLEQELSTPLFEKIGRKMLLTKAGEQLIPYVDDVLGAVDRLQYFENDLKECQGDLRVGVAETQLCYRMPSILKEFHKRAPKARLLLRAMNCYDIRDELLQGSLDLGIFYEDVGDFGSNLVAHPCGSYSLALVASPEVKEEFSDFITPDRIMNIPFVINEPRCIFRQMFERYIHERSIRLDYIIELWSIPTIKNLVKNNVGISFLPKFVVEDEFEKGELVEIPTEITNAKISAICAHHKNKWVSPLMQLFIDLTSEMKNGSF